MLDDVFEEVDAYIVVVAPTGSYPDFLYKPAIKQAQEQGENPSMAVRRILFHNHQVIWKHIFHQNNSKMKFTLGLGSLIVGLSQWQIMEQKTRMILSSS